MGEKLKTILLDALLLVIAVAICSSVLTFCSVFSMRTIDLIVGGG